MAKFRITDTRQFPAADPTRVGKFDTIIVYQMIETGQIYFVTIPKSKVTDTDIKKAVGEDVASRSAMIGKEFEI